MKKLLVTGGSGYLGKRVVELAHNWDVTYTWFRKPPKDALRGDPKQVDLCDLDQVQQMVMACDPDIIIHTACSDRSEDAIVPAASNISTLASQQSVRLVHVSTDMVLDGKHPPYRDEAKPCPLSSYGAAKANAELMVRDVVQSALVVRTSLIFGTDPLDRQTTWLVEGLEKRLELRLFQDEYRCPIWVDNLATALLELANSDLSGFLNVAGSQSVNRWQLGMKLLSFLGLQSEKNVRPAKLSESGMLRPADLTLDTRRARAYLRTPLLTVDEALEQMSRHTVSNS